MSTGDLFALGESGALAFEQRAARLRKILQKYAHAYYTLDRSLVSDSEYDSLFSELQRLEEKYPNLIVSDSPTQRVGSEPVSAFASVRHSLPMLSIKSDTTYKKEAAIGFDESVRKALGQSSVDAVEYCVELKFDGLAVNLRYEKGFLVQAATRGNGEIGEDVTLNLRTIKRVPLKLLGVDAEVIEVRGEVYMRSAEFERYNAKQVECGLEPLINPRNAAAGSVRQLDSKLAAARPLSFYAYGVGEVKGWQVPDHQSELLDRLEEMSVPVCDIRTVVKGASGLVAFYEKILAQRSDLPFEIDGLVYKVNNRQIQEHLGFRATTPHWAFAHKFRPEEKRTTVLGIDVQVGRTGKLTPVAKLSPVFVGGVTVSNVTLHNESQIRKKDIRLGDTVIVRRAGDVIPEIVSVLLDKRVVDASIFKMPSKCPVCGSDAAQEEGEVDYRCTGGFACGAQRKEAIWHFGQRKAMNIDGLGEELIDKLVDNDLVTTPASLYRLKYEDLLGLQLGGNSTLQHQSVTNLLTAIEGSKRPELRRFIFSLGIRHVGEATAKQLADQFGDLDNLKQASSKLLALLDGVGDETGLAISQFFEQSNNRKVVEDLVGECGIHYVKPAPATQSISFFNLLKSVRGDEPALMKEIGLLPKDSPLRGIGDKSFQLIAQQFGTPTLFLDAVKRDPTLPEFYRLLADKMQSNAWIKAIHQVEDFGFHWDSEELKIVDSNPAPISDKLRRILLSKTDLKETEIDQLTEQSGWALVYASGTTKPAAKDKRYQVCFTGFGNSEKEELGTIADHAKLRVVTGVTKDLQFLVAGDHAGPAKLQKAHDQGTRVLNKTQFLVFLETGELSRVDWSQK